MKATLLVVFGIGAVLLWIAVGVQAWHVKKDINQVQYRAQVAADADRMAEFLDDLIGNMESRGMTSGHSAVFFRGPGNDVGQDYEAVVAIRDRARLLATLDHTSTAYQSGLDDLRGTLREVSINAWYFEAFRGALFWSAWLGTILFTLTLIVIGGRFMLDTGY